MRPTRTSVTLTLALLASISAAPRPAVAQAGAGVGGSVVYDPYERFNRRMFAFNRRLDRAVLSPLSRVTSGLTPGPVGRAIHNFTVNLQEPVVVVNDLLQLKPVRAVKSLFRLVVNSIAGGLGAVDVARALGDRAQKNGFGDTLGRWGAQPGPYLILPVLGPADFRDLVGSVADDATEPLQFIDFPYRTEVDITVSFVGGLNERARLGPEYDALLAGAADPYATLRSSYMQSREAEIRGEAALPPLPEIDEAPAEPPAPTGVPTPPTEEPPPAATPPSAAPAPAPAAPAPSP